MPIARTTEPLADLDRRQWMRRAFAATGLGTLLAQKPLQAGGLGIANPNPSFTEDEPPQEATLEQMKTKMHDLGLQDVVAVESDHYAAAGDAPEAFMRMILGDCQQLVRDYFRYFQTQGFTLEKPKQRLLVAMFRDDKSFGKYLGLPSMQEAAADGQPLQAAGVYDRATNLLHVFDWRSVPMASRSASRNMETLAHEGTHQLTFNTGVLRRPGDIPLCLIEGFGTYGEARKTMGPSELGRLNLKRMDDLAKLQRKIPWIPLRELLTDDTVLRAGLAGRIMLGYAQSWLLIHYMMNHRELLPRFRDYLNVVKSRDNDKDRLKDFETFFGDPDAHDPSLQKYAIRLQMSLQ